MIKTWQLSPSGWLSLLLSVVRPVI